MKQIIIAFLTVSFLLSLQFLLPQKIFKKYNDDELRKVALSHAMQSNPKNFNELKKIFDDKNNPLSKDKIILGKKLYFDTILSKDYIVSCNSCHTIKQHNKPLLLNSMLGKTKDTLNCTACHAMDNSGTDRNTFSIGSTESPYKLNAQTILNAALAKSFTWSGEVNSLYEQISNSIQDDTKMNLSKNEVVKRLKENPVYQIQFNDVFHEDISFDNVVKAIDAYVKTLLTRGSYDRFLDGDNNAISDEAKRGFADFINFGCKGCHTGRGVGGQSVQMFPLRHFARIFDLRVNYSFEENKIIDNSFPFENKGGYKGRNGTNFFRVPLLRNVAKTSPYFHNGAVFKIRKAVDIMAKHQTGKNLTNVQIDEIVEFLKTLSGDIVDYGDFNDK